MGAEIDRLEIAIESKATKANNALDGIVNKLERLSNTLNSVNGGGLTAFAQGIEKIAGASSQLHNVKTDDFTRLAENIKKISAVDSKQLYSMSQAMRTMANSMNGIGKASANSTAVATLATSISKLGNKSVASAITNMPRLASGLNSMMATLSKAPAVSKNLIQMTNALSNLASQGSRVGITSNSLVSVLNRTGSAMSRTKEHTLSLAAAFGKFYASYRLVVLGVGELWGSLKSSMGYVETLNYFDAAFGQVAENAVGQWESAGYESAEAYYDSFSSRAKELTAKMTGFSINSNGTLTETGAPSLGIDPAKLMNYQAMFAQMSSSMGVASETSLKLSEALTKIGADLASVKNMDFDKVWKDMASGLAGMSRTLDKYGANIRNVNLQQKLNELGIKANIQSLNQNEKALLRGIILLDSTRYAWGDLADTLNQPANQLRLLSANFGNLARAIGNLFLPVVAKILPYINGLVIALQRLVGWVGGLLGIDIGKITSSVGGSSDDLSDLLDSADGASDALGNAADNAKKLKNITMGIDELNIISKQDESGSGGGAGGGIGSGLLDDAFLDVFDDYQKAWDKAFASVDNKAKEIADRIVDAFKRGDWYGIGEYISTSLRDALNKIPWETVYEGARKFGTGLAQFMNGLIRPDTFYAVGKTIAGALNTALHALNAFAKEFNWQNLGKSLASGLKGFFKNWDAGLTAETFSNFAKGILETMTSFFETLGDDDTFEIIGQKLVDFVCGVDWYGLTWNFYQFFKVCAEKMSEFPYDFARGVAEGIIEKIFNIDDVKIETPEWMDKLFKHLFTVPFPSLSIMNLLPDLEETKKKFEDLYESVQGFWEKIKPYFEKDTWIGLGQGIVDGFEQSFRELNELIAEKVCVVWEKIDPLFNSETWYNLGQGILDGIGLKWEEFKLWWQESALLTWWEENVVPWFSLDTWHTLADGILQGISTKWNELVKLWTTNITKWWNTNVAPWFTIARWQALGENLKNGVFNGFKGIAQKTVDVLNSIIAAFESMVNKVVKKVNDLIEKINDALGEFVPNIPTIKFKADFGRIPVPQFADGGFPISGEMFLARENGINEYVGRIGHRSAVANNDQIVESVSIGVAHGVETAVANALAPYLQQIAQNTRETADKDMSVNIGDRDIARANIRGRQSMGLQLRTT